MPSSAEEMTATPVLNAIETPAPLRPAAAVLETPGLPFPDSLAPDPELLMTASTRGTRATAGNILADRQSGGSCCESGRCYVEGLQGVVGDRLGDCQPSGSSVPRDGGSAEEGTLGGRENSLVEQQVSGHFAPRQGVAKGTSGDSLTDLRNCKTPALSGGGEGIQGVAAESCENNSPPPVIFDQGRQPYESLGRAQSGGEAATQRSSKPQGTTGQPSHIPAGAQPGGEATYQAPAARAAECQPSEQVERPLLTDALDSAMPRLQVITGPFCCPPKNTLHIAHSMSKTPAVL